MTFCLHFRLGCASARFLLQLPDVIDVVVVIADCNRENLLASSCLITKTIEMRFDCRVQKMKFEVLCLFRWAFSSVPARPCPAG